MTIEEIANLLDSHGSDAGNWPPETRTQALALLASSEAAQQLFEQQQVLDSLLDQLPVPEFNGLESRVLSQSLPPRQRSLIDTLTAWLTPRPGLSNLWRPATAACLPLVFGILVGNYYSFGVLAEDDGFQYWEDELTMLSLSDFTEAQL